MKKVAIIQSSYIPWKGYFDIIHDVDLFIFLDDVQYTNRDWRSRNKIKTPSGTSWLTIPVGSHRDKLIHEIQLFDKSWAEKHWKTIKLFYSKAPHFKMYKDFFEHIYLERDWNNLSELNQFLTKSISAELLESKTEFKDSREYCAGGRKFDLILDLVQKADADLYISGPAAKAYIDEKKFEDIGIKLVFKDFSNYPEYPQFYPPFEHQVTILDLLFHVGADAPYYIWGWRNEKPAVLDLETASQISPAHNASE